MSRQQRIGSMATTSAVPLEAMSLVAGLIQPWVTYNLGLVLREKFALASCRREMVGTYVDSIAIADPNAYRNTLDRQDSKAVQDGITIRAASE